MEASRHRTCVQSQWQVVEKSVHDDVVVQGRFSQGLLCLSVFCLFCLSFVIVTSTTLVCIYIRGFLLISWIILFQFNENLTMLTPLVTLFCVQNVLSVWISWQRLSVDAFFVLLKSCGCADLSTDLHEDYIGGTLVTTYTLNKLDSIKYLFILHQLLHPSWWDVILVGDSFARNEF